MGHQPVLSVVDYAAWEKGYMPPSEHILIDKLAYRGAKVILSFSVGNKGEQVWLVLEGGPLTSAKRKFMLEIMQRWFDIDESDEPPFEPQRFTIFMDGADRFVLSDAESNEPTNPVYATREEAEAALAERLKE